ncbi:nitrate- and nitrite sensing domain-containing protein [Streptomyces sp. NPDC007205]|uniref:nitrate- and nitrite sensing domain-containing protein n=1 Tax=Streptomyces sp. NPDC007205 TaxID=3154316 RepID=UPI0033FE135F
MQKKRPRRTGRQTAPTGTAQQTPAGTGRPTHVRTRLIVAVAVVAAAVAGAGAPSLLTASQDVSDSQDLVTLAARTQDALALANSLADERDEVTSYIAAGRPKSKAPSEDRSARVDRQVEDLRADTDTPAGLRGDLDGIDAVRRAALTGKTSALQTHQAYSETITALHRLAEQLAEQTPPRAGSGAHALAELDTAVQQSAAARGLLLAALNVPAGTRTVINPVTGLPATTSTTSTADRKQRDQLTAAAQQARLRADAALADFRATAPKAAVDSYDSTVTGSDVNSAEKYLASLTDQPTLADSELTTSTKKLDAALSARVDLMRGAESALYDHRTKDLAQLRDDDVTALEIRVAVLGALMLVAIGIATAMARTLTRPLSVLRRGSARLAESEDPTTQEPIAFTGRNDEFAQVVRSVNALHAHAVALREQTVAAGERVATLETDRKHLVGQRQKMADAREELRAELSDAVARLERLRTSIGGTFVNLSLRTLGLVERQLAVIEGLEDREQDPDRLATLFKLDHFATVMRRHSENLLVLAGAEHVQQHHGPVPLVDVVRAGVSEIERYERVRIAALPPHAHVAGFAADDVSHLLAELMENATSFSPPELPVELSGWLLESGEVMLSVQDEGIGMASERLDHLNSRLTDFDPESPYDNEGDAGLGLGLYVVARLAHRHGVRVQLREQKQGGIAAVVVLPATLLTEAPPTTLPPQTSSPSTTGTFSLPGADAEVNSNVLPARPKAPDPLVALAERAVRGANASGGSAGMGVSGSGGLAEGAAVSGGSAEAGASASGGLAEADASGSGGSAGMGVSGSGESAEGAAVSGGSAEAGVSGSGGLAEAGASGSGGSAEMGASGSGGSAEGDVLASRGAAEEGGSASGGAGGSVGEDVLASRGSVEEGVSGSGGSVAGEASVSRGPLESGSASDASGGPGDDAEAAEGAFGGSAADVDGVDLGGSAHDAVWDAFGGRSEPTARDAHAGHGEDAAQAVHEQADADAQNAETRPKAPAETYAETTMELLLPDLATEPTADRTEAPQALFTDPSAADGGRAPQGPPAPDDESRTGGAGGNENPAEGEAEAVTAKGLPKRTPKITVPAQAPRRRAGTVDAEALRRRLGGFRSGAQAGYRAVEAETAHAEEATEATGGTAEEASS